MSGNTYTLPFRGWFGLATFKVHGQNVAITLKVLFSVSGAERIKTNQKLHAGEKWGAPWATTVQHWNLVPRYWTSGSQTYGTVAASVLSRAAESPCHCNRHLQQMLRKRKTQLSLCTHPKSYLNSDKGTCFGLAARFLSFPPTKHKGKGGCTFSFLVLEQEKHAPWRMWKC